MGGGREGSCPADVASPQLGLRLGAPRYRRALNPLRPGACTLRDLNGSLVPTCLPCPLAQRAATPRCVSGWGRPASSVLVASWGAAPPMRVCTCCGVSRPPGGTAVARALFTFCLGSTIQHMFGSQNSSGSLFTSLIFRLLQNCCRNTTHTTIVGLCEIIHVECLMGNGLWFSLSHRSVWFETALHLDRKGDFACRAGVLVRKTAPGHLRADPRAVANLLQPRHRLFCVPRGPRGHPGRGACRSSDRKAPIGRTELN